MSEKMIKEVTIPAKEQHAGVHAVKLKLHWICPVCGEPRGEIFLTHSFDGSRKLWCDGWKNPCGHIDKYADVREEAMSNDLNLKEVWNEK